MGKRCDFERKPRDFYPTPFAAVEPLVKHLTQGFTFAEPCAGDGQLCRHLEYFGGSNDKNFNGWKSFTSRIRPSHILKVEFGKCSAELFELCNHKSKVAVILSDFDTDIEGKLIEGEAID